MKEANLIKKSFRLKRKRLIYLEKESAAKEMTISSYLRALIDADEQQQLVQHGQARMSLSRELINEVNHIGVNINQIVRNNNAQFYSAAEKKKLFLMMQQLNDMLYASLR